MVTQTDLDNLNAAIASGVRTAILGEQQVTYNTTDSLIKARDDIARQLAAENAALRARRGRQTYLYYAGRGND